VCPNATTLTFDVYPIIGNKADMNAVIASCSVTPYATTALPRRGLPRVRQCGVLARSLVVVGTEHR
jgi:hypothetical protein